jgi:orotidine-5'-phosphate decarboxylase
MKHDLTGKAPDNDPVIIANNDDPVIVALDFDSAQEAGALVSALGEAATFYKVGMELFAAAGMDSVRRLVESGKRVFLDLKYYDIGETVRRAVAVAARSGASFLTVHAVGQVMRAAVEGRGETPMKLLAVTVLTSLDQRDLEEMGHSQPVSELVGRRVKQAMEAGIDGLVASPLEAANIRALAGPKAVLVTPGVRSAGAARGDQKRVATPAEAVAAGADYIVIGRQVTRAADPAAALHSIREELSGAR